MKTTNRKGRTAVAGALGLALALGLTGCGHSTPQPAAAPAPSVKPVGTPDPANPGTPANPGGPASPGAPAPVGPAPTPNSDTNYKAFTGPAADKFGADNVMAAYKFATAYALKANFNPSLLANAAPRQVDFSYLDEGLSPAAVAILHGLTAKAADQKTPISKDDTDKLVALTSYDLVSGTPYTLRDPVVRNAGFGGATAEVLDTPGHPTDLVLRFPLSGTFLLTDKAGKPVAIDTHRDQAFTLSLTGRADQPWQIDGWSGHYTTSAPRPDTQK